MGGRGRTAGPWGGTGRGYCARKGAEGPGCGGGTAGFCGGGGRGGLRQGSLGASARVRVFNSISHTADGETGAGLRCLFGCSPWGIRREYVFLTFIWGLDAEGEMAYPMMPRINPKRSLKRFRLIPDSGLMETGRETVS